MPQAPKPVRKAVFPVAGMGTRFLAASKAVPKAYRKVGGGIIDLMAGNSGALSQMAQIQLTDAMAQRIGTMPFHAVKTDCARYDCGDKVGFLHANIAIGLSRADIATALKKILTDLEQ